MSGINCRLGELRTSLLHILPSLASFSYWLNTKVLTPDIYKAVFQSEDCPEICEKVKYRVYFTDLY